MVLYYRLCDPEPSAKVTIRGRVRGESHIAEAGGGGGLILMPKRRLTGISTPWGGASWDYRETDADIARRLITFLEDRRVLYEPLNAQTFFYVGRSAGEIRETLTGALDGVTAEPLAELIREVRALLRGFMSELDRIAQSGLYEPFERDQQVLALGEMRGRVNPLVAQIAAKYEIEVEEELAAALNPPSDAADNKETDATT
jgi:hypothetical protein